MPVDVAMRGTDEVAQKARTLTSREVDINTTKSRINVHDGITPGGVPHATSKDVIGSYFNYSNASGIDAISISLPYPILAYAAGQRFTFKAQNTNTGAATFNVDAISALTLKKKDVFSGALSNLSAGDIIAGGVYDVVVLDTSTALVMSIDSGGLQDVGQGDLRTSTGTISLATQNNQWEVNSSLDIALSSVSSSVVLPGGEYGFYPLCRCNDINHSMGWWPVNNTSTYVARAMPYAYGHSPSGKIVRGLQRYVASSPPFDMGDGEVGGFLFLMLDKSGKVAGTYFADVPPWAYNGKTNIQACKQCPVTGKKYRRAKKTQSLEQVMDGEAAEYELQEITQVLKQADMVDIPHPFGDVSSDLTPVLVDPMDERISSLLSYQNDGGGDDLHKAIEDGLITADNEPLSRRGPRDVMQVGLKYKGSSIKSGKKKKGD